MLHKYFFSLQKLFSFIAFVQDTICKRRAVGYKVHLGTTEWTCFKGIYFAP